MAVRAALFFALWLALAGLKASDLPAAAVAVVAATWLSLRLLPPGGHAVSPAGLLRLALRFPGQSLAAGLDVAVRALRPGLPLRPGFVTYQTSLPPGAARDAFLTYASLMPGTLPADDAPGGAVLVHCLDVSQPAAEQLAAEEARFARALGRPLTGRRGDG